VKQHWRDDEAADTSIAHDDRERLKPGRLQNQLSDVIALIGRPISPTFGRFSRNQWRIENCTRSLFRRYRYESRSDRLWLEIKYVLQNFAQPLTDLFLAAMDYAAAQASASNKDGLQTVCGCLLLICKIFYSLNYQDIPEFFEDNMPKWMPRLRELLAAAQPAIGSQICEIVSLYACKYDEEFAPYLPDFVKDLGNAIKFLASVAERPQNKQLFGEPETLRQLYIRRDMEGSDQDTRRRAACDLVRALCKSFEGPVIGHFSQYVQHLLQEYSANRQSAWRSKDAALYLVTSLAAKAQTSRHGVTQATELVNMAEFCRTQALPELQESGLFGAACLKFLVTFPIATAARYDYRRLPLAVAHLAAESPVCHSYAAAFLENAQTVAQCRSSGAVPGSVWPVEPSGLGENDYAMKCLMRSLFTYKRRSLSCFGLIVPRLTYIIQQVSKNPSKPLFNHYLFESLCLCVTTACQADSSSAAQFEAALFRCFRIFYSGMLPTFCPTLF
uniref:Cse1 domain-containing protein n=1 Tax=Macrostomum lignano TaxID=282301 RepID=A0A1I8F801_9PLAT